MNSFGPFAKPQGDGPAPGEIPGLRGAPVRTPVRATGAATGPALWPAIAGRLLTRQLWIEAYGLPGYALTLKGRKALAFAATPRDFRPVD
ncbi:MAG: heparinase, partial [Brevundimonas sp.]